MSIKYVRFIAIFDIFCHYRKKTFGTILALNLFLSFLLFLSNEKFKNVYNVKSL